MEVVLYIVLLIATFLTMEGITWLTHKYVMHGFYGSCIAITISNRKDFLKRTIGSLSFLRFRALH